MFSANGAAFIASPPQDGFAVANLGQSPRETSKCKPPALKARFIRALSRAFSAKQTSDRCRPYGARHRINFKL
jgi:hypothetical protein